AHRGAVTDDGGEVLASTEGEDAGRADGERRCSQDPLSRDARSLDEEVGSVALGAEAASGAKGVHAAQRQGAQERVALDEAIAAGARRQELMEALAEPRAQVLMKALTGQGAALDERAEQLSLRR